MGFISEISCVITGKNICYGHYMHEWGIFTKTETIEFYVSSKLVFCKKKLNYWILILSF